MVEFGMVPSSVQTAIDALVPSKGMPRRLLQRFEPSKVEVYHGLCLSTHDSSVEPDLQWGQVSRIDLVPSLSQPASELTSDRPSGVGRLKQRGPKVVEHPLIDDHHVNIRLIREGPEIPPGLRLKPNLPLPITLMSALATPSPVESSSRNASHATTRGWNTYGASSLRKHGPSNSMSVWRRSSSLNSAEVIPQISPFYREGVPRVH
jgi:hypothetical protein